MDSFLKIEELHHIGIAVKDFDEILIFFSLLGYEKTSSTSVRDELQKVDLIFLTHKKNHPSIELVKPYTADSPVNGYLKNNNTAFYHICYEVSSIEDIGKDWRRFIKGKKVFSISDTDVYGKVLPFAIMLVPMFLILGQDDTGSALVFSSFLLLVLKKKTSVFHGS